MLTQLT